MRIEIDQSGKLDFPGPSIFAFSNGECGSIYVGHKVKLKVFNYYEKHPHYSKETMRKRIKVRFFVACVSFLLTKLKNRKGKIVIDNELDSYQDYLKELLIHRLQKLGFSIKQVSIDVDSVGKKSPADFLAGEVRVGKRKPDIVVSFEDLIPLL